MEWKINAMCGLFAIALIFDFHLWNLILIYLALANVPRIISDVAGLLLIILDAIPHPTTIGYWILRPYGFYPLPPELYTVGIFGMKKIMKKIIDAREIRAILLGFTGIIFTVLLVRCLWFLPFYCYEGGRMI